MSSRESQPIDTSVRGVYNITPFDKVLPTRKKSHCERLSVASNEIGLATFVMGGLSVGIRVARYRPMLMLGSCSWKCSTWLVPAVFSLSYEVILEDEDDKQMLDKEPHKRGDWKNNPWCSSGNSRGPYMANGTAGRHSDLEVSNR